MKSLQYLAHLCVLASFTHQSLAGACYPTTSTSVGGAAFSVLEDGTISIGSEGDSKTCQVTFSGSSNVNVVSDDLYQADPSKTDCGLTASDTTLDHLTLPTFLTTSSSSIFRYKNSGDTFQYPSNWYRLDNSKTQFCVNGTSPCTTDIGYNTPDDEVASYLLSIQNSGSTYTAVFDNRQGSEWQEIEGGTGSQGEIYFNYAVTTPETPYRINYLNISNTDVIYFEPGSYYINKMYLADRVTIEVAMTEEDGSAAGDGSGVVKLYLYDGTSIIGNGACINVAGCEPGNPDERDDIQYPERLYISVYTGDFTINDQAQVAAGIYVDDGTLEIKANSGTYFVGEALASDIQVGNNSGVEYAYQNTGMFTELYIDSAAESVTPNDGIYSLASPAVNPSSNIGDLSYIPYQTDDTTDVSSTDSLTMDTTSDYYGTGITGHLMAFPLTSSGTSSTASWDANDQMTTDLREERLWSTDASGNLVKFANLDDAAFGTLSDLATETIINYTITPNYADGDYLGDRDSSSWIGAPYTTQPVILGDLVIFHTDDGFVYAIDSSSGELQWGFMPRPLVSYLDDYSSFYTQHYMEGQIATIGDDIVVGSAKGGALHYALKLSSSGGLSSVLWVEESGGDNPHRPITFTNNDKQYALYVTNSTDIVVQELTSGASQKVYDVSSKTSQITSMPLAYQYYSSDGSSNKQNIEVSFGDNEGNVYSALVVNNGSLKNSPSWSKVGNVGTSSTVAKSVLWLQSATLAGDDYLVAQTTERMKVFRLPAAENSWQSDWISMVGESGYWNDSGASYTKETDHSNNYEHIQLLEDDVTITDQVEIAASVIFLPLQRDTEESCDAYYYLYDLDTGLFPSNVLHNDATVDGSNVNIGTGKAYTPTVVVIGDTITLQGHSSENTTTDLGIDNAFTFTTGNQGWSGWRELLDE
ncbi:hypothetical protein [Oceanobacter sp. 4_MG-2023]|uniref:hypothetical protein n=1 Tax=Oceanobacter sp. 4_MG-2023 TaxID=3062623 RepID=UPI0027348148|nr:hypothetical protein [Oceanobacter sp. 4_MG-2023]MDP2546500.1 hypothetical protein [Oceanobacter sp. 4_MG-2023]